MPKSKNRVDNYSTQTANIANGQKRISIHRKLHWVWGHLYTERRGWLLIIALMTILLTISVIINTLSRQNSVIQITFTVFVNLFVALLAAGLIDVFAQFGKYWQMLVKQGEFRQFFGIGVKETDSAKVAVVLPRFETEDQSPVINKLQKIKGYKTLPIRHNYEEFAVRSDVIAAAEIIAAFSEVALQPPTIIWDNEALEHIENSRTTYTTFISVGLLSNVLSNWLSMQTHFNYHFAANTSGDGEDSQFEFLVAKYKDGRLNVNINEWKKYPEDGKDYGFISNITDTNKNITFFVCGANESNGTQRMGKYIRENWRKLREHSATVGGKKIKDASNFTILLEIPPDISHELEPETILVD